MKTPKWKYTYFSTFNKRLELLELLRVEGENGWELAGIDKRMFGWCDYIFKKKYLDE